MKKGLLSALILTCTLGITTTAFAGPFSDVPAKHWSYDAVTKLAQAGIVEGDQGRYMGDKTMTRYEMAIIVARAMEHADKADAQNKALIEKLSTEYAAELTNLGVRVGKLEDKTKIAINFESRIRYTHDDNKATSPAKSNDGIGSNAFDWRQRIWLNGAVNDTVTYGARLEATNGTFGQGALGVSFNRAWFEAKDFLGSVDSAKIGRFGTYNYTNGLLMGKSSNCDGVILTKKLGDQVTAQGLLFDTGVNSEVKMLNIDYKANSNLKFNFAYEDANFSDNPGNGTGTGAWPVYNSPELVNGLKTHSYDIGSQYKIGGLTLTGEYVYTKDVTNGNIGRKAYALQLTNGVMPYFFPNALIVDSTKTHTDAWAVIYKNIDHNAVPVTSTFNGFQPVFTGTKGGQNYANLAQDDDVKGWMAQYQNVVSKNVVWTVEVQSLKSKSVPTYKDTVWDTSFQFMF